MYGLRWGMASIFPVRFRKAEHWFVILIYDCDPCVSFAKITNLLIAKRGDEFCGESAATFIGIYVTSGR